MEFEKLEGEIKKKDLTTWGTYPHYDYLDDKKMADVPREANEALM